MRSLAALDLIGTPLASERSMAARFANPNNCRAEDRGATFNPKEGIPSSSNPCCRAIGNLQPDRRGNQQPLFSPAKKGITQHFI
jgi:hypothetical protein